MSGGKVLAAARAKNYDSLAKVAQALMEARAELFEDIKVRSLGVKLSELNRNDITWWRKRPDCLEALKDLLGLEPSDLIDSEQARRRGLWVCDEFPELPALNLASEQLPVLAEATPTIPKKTFPDRMEGWLSVGIGSDYEQHPMNRLDKGIRWLHISKGTGRNLLLSQIKARNRLDVWEGDTLAQVVAQASPNRPAVLAPRQPISSTELEVLGTLNPAQPILIVSAYSCPLVEDEAPARQYFPTWEWLSASKQERSRSQFASQKNGISAGAFGRSSIIEFKWQLLSNWQSVLLEWVERRLSKNSETLFTAEGLCNWLEVFDPDNVFFPTPAAVLSLARICHEVGERRLPAPGKEGAGMYLVKQLGGEDSRYQSTLTRLVKHCWLEAGDLWHVARPWDDWLSTHSPVAASPTLKKMPVRSRMFEATGEVRYGPEVLAREDLDSAVRMKLLLLNADGNYGFSSYAEAALVLRDQLRMWMAEGDYEKWSAHLIGSEERQQLVDDVLLHLDNRALLKICHCVSQQPVWSTSALVASESLFLTMGLRLADRTLKFSPELEELLTQVFARCIDDDAFIQLPLSRLLSTSEAKIDWIRAGWGWSLEMPKPEWVPAAISNQFPGWVDGECYWLLHLPIPDWQSGIVPLISVAHFKRLVSAAMTAARVANQAGLSEQTYAPEPLVAVVELLNAVQKGKPVLQSKWWMDIAPVPWAREAISLSLDDIAPKMQRALAISLLEACSKNGDVSSQMAVFELIHSRLWLQVLEVNDAGALCAEMSSQTIRFIAGNIRSFPMSLRCSVANQSDPDDWPSDIDWDALWQSDVLKNSDRVTQLLNRPRLHWAQPIASLWKVHPNYCLQWATDPESPHHEDFRRLCPETMVSELISTLLQESSLVKELNVTSEWAVSQIKNAGINAATVLELVALCTSTEEP